MMPNAVISSGCSVACEYLFQPRRMGCSLCRGCISMLARRCPVPRHCKGITVKLCRLQGQGAHSQRSTAAERPSSSARASAAAASDADQLAARRQRRGVIQRSPAAEQPGRLREGHEAAPGEYHSSMLTHVCSSSGTCPRLNAAGRIGSLAVPVASAVSGARSPISPLACDGFAGRPLLSSPTTTAS